jgi:hypothetical protein
VKLEFEAFHTDRRDFMPILVPGLNTYRALHFNLCMSYSEGARSPRGSGRVGNVKRLSTTPLGNAHCGSPLRPPARKLPSLRGSSCNLYTLSCEGFRPDHETLSLKFPL